MEKDLHEIAGLVRVDDDGEEEWMGTREQWQRYEDLLREKEEGAQPRAGQDPDDDEEEFEQKSEGGYAIQ